MSTRFLYETAQRTAVRYLKPCHFCRINNLRAPLHAPSANFSTSAPTYARKSRLAKPAQEVDGDQTQTPLTGKSDRLADDLADQILDDFFGSGDSRKARKPADRKRVVEEDGGLENDDIRIIDTKATLDPFAESSIPKGEVPMPKIDAQWGSNALPQNEYSRYGIESAEAREKRRIASRTYNQAETTTEEDSVADDWYVEEASIVSEERLSPDDFVPRWMKGIAVAKQRSQGIVLEEDATDAAGPIRLKEIVNVLKEENGKNLAVISMRDKCDYTDFMVIVEGRSKKQIYALADAVRRRAKHRTLQDVSLPNTLTIEGADSEDWMVLDLGRFIVHCFTPEARARYNLEGLWTAIKDPLLALAREPDVDVGETTSERQLTEAERGWDTRPKEDFRLKQIERKHVMAEEEVLEKFNSAR
ncbi:hypothetical protein PhCBS80983_g03633 [Powellomyces hirtus]|uniref:Ribosomal silencing factor RsfS n=1 Tax=Powellomyces hirtus TaxID=109895 RepID=A0A507E0V9_9FUNG|nr:hypothetical protein PhCBS80983_g03633 [Powellomyces hirtus]